MAARKRMPPDAGQGKFRDVPVIASRANESTWKSIKGRLNTGVKSCLNSEHVVRDR